VKLTPFAGILASMTCYFVGLALALLGDTENTEASAYL